MREALVGATDLPSVTQQRRVSAPSAGNATVLLYQNAGDERYYDESCLVSVETAKLIANPCRTTGSSMVQ